MHGKLSILRACVLVLYFLVINGSAMTIPLPIVLKGYLRAKTDFNYIAITGSASPPYLTNLCYFCDATMLGKPVRESNPNQLPGLGCFFGPASRESIGI